MRWASAQESAGDPRETAQGCRTLRLVEKPFRRSARYRRVPQARGVPYSGLISVGRRFVLRRLTHQDGHSSSLRRTPGGERRRLVTSLLDARTQHLHVPGASRDEIAGRSCEGPEAVPYRLEGPRLTTRERGEPEEHRLQDWGRTDRMKSPGGATSRPPERMARWEWDGS